GEYVGSGRLVGSVMCRRDTLSSVVKPGAVRIATTGYTDNGITCSAFENTDGTYAFVLINNNEKSKKITVSDGQRHFAYDVPGKSVTSYRWAKSK
ncbi:hypothetical protein GAC59_11760, partial [Bacteroides thetaiotaomicron]